MGGYAFSKYVSGYFQPGSEWSFCRGSLPQPKLKLKTPELAAEALLIFGAIQRFMGDPHMTHGKEEALALYVVQRGVLNPDLRDEVGRMETGQGAWRENWRLGAVARAAMLIRAVCTVVACRYFASSAIRLGSIPTT